MIPKPYLLICARRFAAILGNAAKTCVGNIADFLSRAAGRSAREAFVHLAVDRVCDKKARGNGSKVCNAVQGKPVVIREQTKQGSTWSQQLIAAHRTAGWLGPNVADVHSRHGRGGRKTNCSAAARACTACELNPFRKGGALLAFQTFFRSKKAKDAHMTESGVPMLITGMALVLYMTSNPFLTPVDQSRSTCTRNTDTNVIQACRHMRGPPLRQLKCDF